MHSQRYCTRRNLTKLSGPVLHQFASWSPTIKIAVKYLHYLGDEAFNEIIELEGIKLAPDPEVNN
jgi:hypothetical protein